MKPSNWYLTGFLIPSDTPFEERADEDEDDVLDEIPKRAGLAEESTEERRAAKKGFFPSSIGLSFLVLESASQLDLTVRWGDYRPGEVKGADGKPIVVWRRHAEERTVSVALSGPPRSQAFRDRAVSGCMLLPDLSMSNAFRTSPVARDPSRYSW